MNDRYSTKESQCVCLLSEKKDSERFRCKKKPKKFCKFIYIIGNKVLVKPKYYLKKNKKKIIVRRI